MAVAVAVAVVVVRLAIVMVRLHQAVMVPLQEEAVATAEVGEDGVAASTNDR